MTLSGELETADIEQTGKVETLLTATQNNKPLKITGSTIDAAKLHTYTIPILKDLLR
jgi:hypothetical protein